MEQREEVIKINGVNPPLHPKDEHGKYSGFLINLRSIILEELNTGKILEVTMIDNQEANKLLTDIKQLNIDPEKEFIMKLEDNLLIVEKKIFYKTGI